jgi:hypothetical protein
MEMEENDSSASRYRKTVSSPHHLEAVRWEAALEHYQWDRLEDAFGLIEEQGVGETGGLLGDYRLIEAELITRRKGVTKRVNGWLTIEYVTREIMGLEQELADRILRACEEVAARLKWSHDRQTWIAILAEETDADWTTYPFGYCATKEPYEKICLPNHLLDDTDEFHRAVAHEYAHVISNNLSEGFAPRWLEEAISVHAEGAIDEKIALEFRTGDSPWVGPDELERVLESRGNDDAEVDRILQAYQQAGWIGRYMSSLGGDAKLRDLLIALADDRVMSNLKLRILGRDRTDGAMRSVYAQSLPQIFDNSLRRLLNG